MFCCANHQFGPARFLKDVLGCFFAVTLMAATALSGTQGGPQVVNQEKSVLVTRLVVTFGTNTTSIWQSGFWDELRIIIRDRATWDTIWKRIVSPDPYHDPYNAVPPLPEIDFSREMLVVTAMGQRPSGGYRIMVNSVLEKNRRLEVEVHSISTCGGAPAIVTAPIDIVRIPKTDIPVSFREIEVRPGCK